MQRTIRQHFVPQCSLCHFTIPGEGGRVKLTPKHLPGLTRLNSQSRFTQIIFKDSRGWLTNVQ